jgi:hypothetical protein
VPFQNRDLLNDALLVVTSQLILRLLVIPYSDLKQSDIRVSLKYYFIKFSPANKLWKVQFSEEMKRNAARRVSITIHTQ